MLDTAQSIAAGHKGGKDELPINDPVVVNTCFRMTDGFFYGFQLLQYNKKYDAYKTWSR